MSDTISSLLQRILTRYAESVDELEMDEADLKAALVRLADVREAAQAQWGRHDWDQEWEYRTGTKVCLCCHKLWPCADADSAERTLAILGVVGEDA